MCCHRLTRRGFLGASTGLIAGMGLASFAEGAGAVSSEIFADEWDPERPFLQPGQPLKVQPVLIYRVAVRREQTSWKSWSGVQSDDKAQEEARRIAGELQSLCARADFAVEVLPVAVVTSAEEAEKIHSRAHDVVLVYPASGGGGTLRACLAGKTPSLIFVRHESGPIYYWYEALSVQYLATGEERPDTEAAPKPATVYDVVVDDYDELLWRLRALYGVKNFVGSRIVALGGPMGKYAPTAPEDARHRFGLEIIEVGYEVFEPRLQKALADARLRALAEAWADKYLALPKTALETERRFVVNAFLLSIVFKELMREHQASAFTINQCMSTIMPMAQTTACLTLSLLNDEGLLAFCESDFVIIPAGILLRQLSGNPVFLHNSTFPHKGIVTCAHCTAPRRMDTAHYEPARILTHYESEYGAAPKVEIPEGQVVTFINPEYSTDRWLGYTGVVVSNPFYDICRSQQDVQIKGDWEKLLKEVRGSHWGMVYGDYLREAGYAARKVGIRWETIV